MKFRMKYFIAILLLICIKQGSAQVRLPRLVRDSMILQRDANIKIWGWSSKGEKVAIKFNNKTYKTKADADGNWSVLLTPTKAGGPYTLDITAKNKITLKEILVGDVWFCSGQSNMVHQMGIHDVLYAKEIAEANNPQIRQFWIATMTNLQAAQNDFPFGNWKSAVGEDIRPFSAVAYFFAKKIYEKYKIPIGIINASVGGTPIEAWTSEEGLKDFSSLVSTIQKNKDTAYINGLNRNAANSNRPQPQITDLGLTGEKKWFDISYVPKGWKNINIPGYWEDQGIKDLNGVVWYRREINIPASMVDKPARVFLGRIIDADILYINGKQVGSTTYQYPQRRYAVATDVLKAGKNIFVIKVTNTAGKGGFVPDKPYCIFAGNDTVDLKGTWQYKVGDVFIPRALGGGGGGINAGSQPTALYNAMVAPAINYTIKGFLWYQGEANTGRAAEYAQLQPAQIIDWRNKWKLGELPFLYAQLPGFMDYNYIPSESNWALFRESQLKSLSTPNAAMAVTIDLGEWNDIHPDNKKDVGERLALAALKTVYGENIVYSGPIYQSATIERNKIIISFSHTGSGLITNDGEAPAEFAIAGEDKKFVWAKAKIKGDKIIVWNDAVPHPMYVRYAWADNPVNPNLYNKEGLPASPFRTDKNP
jgi:sialate O-acetylesterase